MTQKKTAQKKAPQQKKNEGKKTAGKRTGAERVRKALGHTGAQPVDVPGYKSHFVSSVFTATQRLIVMP